MSVSWPANSSNRLSHPSQSEYRGETEEPSSYSLFGVRIDVVAPTVAARVIFEAASDRRCLRVVLADLWTLLLAQRDYSVWESLSGADFVLPSADDPVIRRLTRRRDIAPVWPDHLLHDLLLAMEHSESTLLVMAPADELSADLVLIQRLWPRLRASGIEMGHPEDTPIERERLARAASAGQADVLLLGGNSPWQERWAFEQRSVLHAGAVVLLPSVQASLIAIAQRAGLKVPGPAWMRRRVALQRAYEATLAPAAAASARTLNELLRGPRETLSQSPLGRWRLNPSALHRLALPRSARGTRKALRAPAPVRVAEWHGSDDSAIRRLTASPLERLSTPRATPLPALPPPGGELDVADQPTILFTREELLAHMPDVVTGHIVEPPAAEVIALGPAREPANEATPDSYATTPLPPDTHATTPFPHEEPDAPAEPVRRAVPAPLAPTTLLPGRPRHLKREGALDPSSESAQPADHKPAVVPAPASSIAAPAAPLEELSTLKAHLHARRRLLRRRRKLQSQRRRRD